MRPDEEHGEPNGEEFIVKVEVSLRYVRNSSMVVLTRSLA